MKIQYCSDLHLEFDMNSDYIKRNPINPIGDILILAGDIAHIDSIKINDWFFSYLSDNFDRVYWIPGNHEFYGNNDASILKESFCEKIKSNIFLVNNFTEIIDETKIIMSTMWSYIPEQNSLVCRYKLNDFRYVKYNGERFTTDDFNELHSIAHDYITNEIDKEGAINTVVATHHVPTSLCVAPHHKGTAINSAFMADLSDLIYHSNINYWIYGHSHTNMNRDINGTKIISNQFGYVQMNEIKGYSNDSMVVLDD